MHNGKLPARNRKLPVQNRKLPAQNRKLLLDKKQPPVLSELRPYLRSL